MSNIHKNDVGTLFKLRIVDDATGAVIDISTATEKKIRFRKPNGQVLDKTAVFSTDGTDGYVQYATVVDDLDMKGDWEVQAFVVDSTYENHSEIEEFTVKKNITPDNQT